MGEKEFTGTYAKQARRVHRLRVYGPDTMPLHGCAPRPTRPGKDTPAHRQLPCAVLPLHRSCLAFLSAGVVRSATPDGCAVNASTSCKETAHRNPQVHKRSGERACRCDSTTVSSSAAAQCCNSRLAAAAASTRAPVAVATPPCVCPARTRSVRADRPIAPPRRCCDMPWQRKGSRCPAPRKVNHSDRLHDV